ncbi:MAG: hypothetical protein H6641_07485 [Caldilineaceae bacterium]|nr:hypothetical protein [Caldilineaceae bacterium]
MTKDEFHAMFLSCIENAIEKTEQKLGLETSRNIEVLLHGGGFSNTLMDLQGAANILYLGPEIFYRIIDIAVIGVGSLKTRVFVRASAHDPGPFEGTWNTPSGNGPFKIIYSMEIEHY